MNMRGKAALTANLALLCGVTACSSAPNRDRAGFTSQQFEPAIESHQFDPASDPYWLDPQWDKTMLDAIQSVVHDPVAETDMTTTGPHVTIKFTFADGTIKDPGIIAGTGDPALDDLLLKQVATAHVPTPTGLQANQPHGFLMDLDMLTPFESFKDAIYASVNTQKVYPKRSLIDATIGAVTVDFDYLDGKASDITLFTSSKDSDLNKSSFNAVANAIMPATLPAYAGKLVRMRVIICYSLNGSKNCPDGSNVIVVSGTRFVTRSVM